MNYKHKYIEQKNKYMRFKNKIMNVFGGENENECTLDKSINGYKCKINNEKYDCNEKYDGEKNYDIYKGRSSTNTFKMEKINEKDPEFDKESFMGCKKQHKIKLNPTAKTFVPSSSKQHTALNYNENYTINKDIFDNIVNGLNNLDENKAGTSEYYHSRLNNFINYVFKLLANKDDENKKKIIQNLEDILTHYKNKVYDKEKNLNLNKLMEEILYYLQNILKNPFLQPNLRQEIFSNNPFTNQAKINMIADIKKI